MKRALLYTIDGNADGEAALAYLQARGVAVDLFDVGKDPDASLALFRRLGRLAVPTIVIDERAFAGFEAHREDIAALIRE